MHVHESHEINSVGCDYFVGDLHGSYDKLMVALDAADFDVSQDRLFTVGDLIDRGAASMSCLRLVNQPWFFSVMGNHEDMVLKQLCGTSVDRYFAEEMHRQNGGCWFQQLKLPQKQEVQGLIEGLPVARTVETLFGSVGVIHAAWHKSWSQLTRAKGLESDEYEFATWARHGDPYLQQSVPGIDGVVSGHQNDPYPWKRGNQLWIDTLGQSKAFTLLKAEQVFELLRQADGIVRL